MYLAETGSFLEKLKDILGMVFNEVLIPALMVWLKAVWDVFSDIFLFYLYVLYYYLFTAVLKIVDLMEEAFSIFAGISPITYQKESMSLLQAMMSFDQVRRAFIAITAISIGFALIFTMYRTAKSISDMALENKTPISQVLGSAMKAAITFAAIPFLCLVMVQLSSVVLKGIDTAVTGSNANKVPSIGTIIFLASTMEAGLTNDENEYDYGALFERSADMSESQGAGISFHDDYRGPFYDGHLDADGKEYSIYNLGQVMDHFKLTDIDFRFGMIMAVFIMVMLIGAMIIFIRRLFEIILLYVVSPLFVSTIPLDDGALFGKWRDLFVTKFFAAMGTVITMKLVLILVPDLMGNQIEFVTSPVLNKFIVMFAIAGGTLAAFKSQYLITQILSPEEADRERANMMFLVNSAKKAGKMAADAGMAVASGGSSAALTASAKLASKGGQQFAQSAMKLAQKMPTGGGGDKEDKK